MYKDHMDRVRGLARALVTDRFWKRARFHGFVYTAKRVLETPYWD